MIMITLPFVIPFKAPRRKGNRYFNPLQKEKESMQWLVRGQYPKSKISGLICAEINFYVGIAVSTPKKKNRSMAGTPCGKKLDLDNCAKFILDVLKGVVIEDDSQIWKLTLSKTWAQANRTIIYLFPNEDEEMLD